METNAEMNSLEMKYAKGAPRFAMWKELFENTSEANTFTLTQTSWSAAVVG